SAVDSSQYPDDLLAEMAFAGRSNVGKFSLTDTLVNRKKFAKTSNKSGRTAATKKSSGGR
ncbi:MAG: 50S ribosome-binding GTPase, partial [Syntrophobacterales bacterium]|nr:50S ribosome-binding GTPase [Syntrophobacterales bacterium]